MNQWFAASLVLGFNKGMAKRLESQSKPEISKKVKNSRVAKLPTAKQSGIVLAASIALLIFAVGVWYRSYYSRPSVVLWGAIDKALNTPGVVKQVVKDSEGSSAEVTSLLRYDGKQAIQIETNVDQSSPGPDENTPPTTVHFTAQSLGLPEGDFQRYVEVPSEGIPEDQKVIFLKIKDKWVNTAPGNGQQPGQLFIDGLLGTIPFGNISSARRSQLIAFGRGSEEMQPIFTTDYSAVKRSNNNGRPVMEFELLINNEAYAKWYQQYFADMGFTEFADSRYTAAVIDALELGENTKVTLTVDVLTRQIKTITRMADNQPAPVVERVYAYGIAPELNVPSESLTSEQFQQLISGEAGGEGQ